MPEPRWDLIAHIREQIKAGTYVSDGKLRAVADRLLERSSERPAPGPPRSATDRSTGR